MDENALVLFSGGTGTPKLLTGFSKESNITVIANTADDWDYYGLYVSPDVDSVLYTLAEIIHPERFWGIEADTFNVMNQLKQMGENIWFNLGDRDLAVALYRTHLLDEGYKLTEVTKTLKKVLNCRFNVLPMANERVATHLKTREKGWLHFQEYWVKYHGKFRPESIVFRGIKHTTVTADIKKSILNAAKIVIGPSNPITSINPILSVNGMRKLLKESAATKIVISPFIGNEPVSGPAKVFLETEGYKSPSLTTIVEFYEDLADIIIFDETDRNNLRASGDPSVRERLNFTNIWLNTQTQRENLCQYLQSL